MAVEEQLRQWFVQTSDLIGGDLNDGSTLNEGLEWFGDLDDATLNGMWELGKDNPSIQEFLDLGKTLLHKVIAE